MPIRICKTPLVYHPAPKVACTSLKQAIYRANNGQDFPPNPMGIHAFYKTPGFIRGLVSWRPGDRRFCVVREPVERFVSGYKNRILHTRDLEGRRLGRLSSMPDINEFAMNLEDYMAKVPIVRHHFRPLVHTLGRWPSYYDRIFNLRQIPELVEYVGEYGVSIDVRKTQHEGPKIDSSELGEDSLRKLKKFYAEDYSAYESFF